MTLNRPKDNKWHPVISRVKETAKVNNGRKGGLRPLGQGSADGGLWKGSTDYNRPGPSSVFAGWLWTERCPAQAERDGCAGSRHLSLPTGCQTSCLTLRPTRLSLGMFTELLSQHLNIPTSNHHSLFCQRPVCKVPMKDER